MLAGPWQPGQRSAMFVSMTSLRAQYRAAVGGLPGAFWTLWGGLLINRIATFIGAFLATYLVRVRGLGTAEAGRVVALFGIGLTLAGPVGGAMADRVGRRATMALGLLAGAVAAGALAVAESLAALALLAFVAGLSEVYRPAMNAAVSDVVPEPDRPRAYALVYWVVNLGLAVGLLAAGLIAERSLAALFLADAVTSALFASVILLRMPETLPRGLSRESEFRGMVRTFGDGPFAALLGLQLLAYLVFLQWQLGLPLDMSAHGYGPASYSLLMAINCIGVVVAQPLLAPRLARFRPGSMLAAMSLCFGLGYGLNAVGGSFAIYVLGTALWTVGELVGFPVAAALVADLSPVELRGRYQGAYSMTTGLGFTLGPLLGGEILERWGGRSLWMACLLVGLTAAAGHLAAEKARQQRPRSREMRGVRAGDFGTGKDVG